MSGRSKDPRDFWSSITASRLSDLDLLSRSSNARIDDIRRQCLDDEIAAMTVALSGLKERRNLLYCKPNFPQEVLEYIFAYVASNEILGQGRTEAKKPLGSFNDLITIRHAIESRTYEILGWAKLTHVCRAWRAIALAGGNRWLWSTMDTGRLSADSMYEILDRSHPHPVTPNVTLSMHPDEILVFDILLKPEYMSRLKSLQIVADECVPSEDFNAGQRMADHTSNFLCSLTEGSISTTCRMFESLAIAYNDHAGSDFVLTLPYTGLLAPYLRRLTLKNVQLLLDQDIVTYPQLTHLDITLGIQKATDNYIAGFLEVLRGSPNLQVLSLVGSLPMMDPIESLDEEHMEASRVELLCLEDLRLRGTCHDCSQFGKYLNVPDTCTISINTISRQFEDELVYKRHLRPLLQRWAGSPSLLDVSLLEYPIPLMRVWNTTMTEGPSENKRAFVYKLPRLRLQLIIMSHVREYSGPSSLLPTPLKASFWDMLLYGSLSFKGLTTLHVSSTDASIRNPQWWIKLFRDATAMQCVGVSGAMAVKGLVSALNPYVFHSIGQRHEEPLFPDLKTLHLRCFSSAVSIESHDLRNCLQARRDEGLSNVMDIKFAFSDGTLSADFEDSLGDLKGLATCHIKVDT